jgi:hypothetical protein
MTVEEAKKILGSIESHLTNISVRMDKMEEAIYSLISLLENNEPLMKKISTWQKSLKTKQQV